MAMVCRCTMASPLLLLLLVVLSPNPTVGGDKQSIGACFRKKGDNLPLPQDVVRLCKSNGIYKMRIYSPDVDLLQALRGSAITLVVDVRNEILNLFGSNPTTAAHWVQNYVVPYASNIKYISVGNYVMPNDSCAGFLLPAMQNVQKALQATNLHRQIKVSTAVKSSALNDTFPPSSSNFGSNTAYFKPIVHFLKSNGSPLSASIFPYFSLVENNGSISLPYALFTSSSTVFTDSGNSLDYQNLFDALVDCFYAALEKVGGEGVGIIVSESGWPSQGSYVATPNNAATYYRNLIANVAGGTPKKPGQPLETYLFTLFDDNEEPDNEVQRHFGLFTPPQYNKYQISYFGVPVLLGYLCYD